MRGQWGDTGIVGRYGVNRPGPVTAPTWKQKAATLFPGKFLHTSKVADLDFRSIARKHASYNSLSSWGPERDAEVMRSFCYCGEKQSEKWPQSRVIGAFQCTGIWITMLTLWRHPATPGSGVTFRNKEVNVCNFGNLKFCVYDRHQRGHWPGRSRRGDGWWWWCFLWCLRFHSSSESLGSGVSQWDLFHMVTKRLHAGPQHQTATLAGRATHLHNGSSVTPVSRQRFAFDLSSRKVTLQNRSKKIKK